MTARVEEVTAPSRGWRLHRRVIAEGVLVLLLAIASVLFLSGQAARQPFSVDESRWISTSRYFWITFVERDLFGPAWQPNYLVLTHPPVARYLIGVGLALQGWTPDELNGRYDTDRSRDYNRRAGNIPTRELLDDARRVVLVFAVAATLLFYPIGRRLAGPLAGSAAVVLALAHPLLSTLWTRALAESVLAFFSLLAFWLALRVSDLTETRRSRLGWSVALGIAVGLATATKLSGSLLGCGLALFVLARQAARWWTDRSWSGIGAWTDAGLAAVLTFVLVNPLLYPNPAFRTLMLFEHRRDEMEQQALGTPRLAVPDDIFVRAEVTYRRTFLDWGTFEDRLGLPIDGPLTAVGLAVTAAATWQSLRRRQALGPMTLLLCWTLSVYIISTVNLGFDSSHYFAPPATIAVLLQAVAVATLATAAWRLARGRRHVTEGRARPPRDRALAGR
jgi:hypothetical protein